MSDPLNLLVGVGPFPRAKTPMIAVAQDAKWDRAV